MPKQEFRQFGVWPETHRALKHLSFLSEKPLAHLAEEAVQLLQAHYGVPQPTPRRIDAAEAPAANTAA